MTAYNLYPRFTDREGYLGWRRAWADTYRTLSLQIRKAKLRSKDAQRGGGKQDDAQTRAVGRKMMALLEEAKLRRDRILDMQRSIADQGFPVDLGVCKNVDFHYNKASGEFSFMPMWALRAKGKTFYVNEVEANVPWTTKARATGSTRGVMRFPRCRISIDQHGNAKILLDGMGGSA